MSAILEALDRHPYSRAVLAVALLLVLIAAKLLFGEDSEDPLAQLDQAMQDRVARVESSLNRLLISDPALLACVRRAAMDRARVHPLEGGGIDDVSELKLLHCPRAGIRDLDGIAALTGLTYVNVDHNSIRSLDPLYGHARIEKLRLQRNPLSDIRVVKSMPALQDVQLPDIPSAKCTDLELLLAGIDSNVHRIGCEGREEKQEKKAGNAVADSWTQAAPTEDPNRLTGSQQDELIRYEQNQRYRRN